MKPILFTLFVAFLTAALPAEDVTSWRNGGNGLYPHVNPATNWNDPSAILWEVETPDWANAAPLIIGNRLIYTVEPTTLICLDAATGQQLWEVSNSYEDVANLGPEMQTRLIRAKQQKEILEIELKPLRQELYKINRRYQRDKDNAALRDQVRAVRKKIADLEAKADPILKRFELPKSHATNGYASYTPCSDGEYIYNCNGLGIVTKHDLNGNRVWSKVMEKPDHNWGGSTSPQLVGGKLIIRFSDYTALDPETGDELWRVANPINWGTPSSFQVEGQSFLYTGRGELIRVSDGKNCLLKIGQSLKRNSPSSIRTSYRATGYMRFTEPKHYRATCIVWKFRRQSPRSKLMDFKKSGTPTSLRNDTMPLPSYTRGSSTFSPWGRFSRFSKLIRVSSSTAIKFPAAWTAPSRDCCWLTA